MSLSPLELSSEAQFLNEGIRENARGGSIKWICVAIELILFVICVPIMYRHRRKPMIYFRCWSMQAMSVFFLITHKAAEAALNTPSLASVSNYTILKVISMGASCMLFPSFIAMILRHHFLLQHPPIQAGLAMVAQSGDSESYSRLFVRLKRNKLLYSTFSTWMYWLIHSAILLTFMTIMFVFYFSMEDDIFGVANTYTIISVLVLILEPFLMTFLLLALIPQKPQENYAITRQLQVITWLTAANMLIAIICGVLPQTNYVKVITIVNAALFPLLITAADLIIQIWPDQWNMLTFKRRANPFKAPKRPDTFVTAVKSSKTILPLQCNNSSNTDAHCVTQDADSLMRINTSMGSLTRAARLDDILNSPTRLEKFQSFMCREFCLENILFLVAVVRYRAEVTEEAELSPRIALARSIYRDYLEAGAINELNLPQSLVKDIRNKIDKIEEEGDCENDVLPTLFNEAETHISDLVVCNNLGRFMMYDDRLKPIKPAL